MIVAYHCPKEKKKNAKMAKGRKMTSITKRSGFNIVSQRVNHIDIARIVVGLNYILHSP
jgi:hypothetical protein